MYVYSFPLMFKSSFMPLTSITFCQNTISLFERGYSHALVMLLWSMYFIH